MNNLNSENFIENFDASKKVFIANQSGHDFSQSEKYGTPVYVTKGIVNRFAVNFMSRKWAIALKSSTKEDFVLLTSLTILTVVGAAIFGYLHGRLNLLIYRNGKYICRQIIFDELFKSLEDLNEEDKDQ